jgi:LCP family protein required for cell wall assembly
MFDPGSKHVSLLSVPRDLWVSVPGEGEDRINTAFFRGQGYDVKNGGPGLAALTVEYNLGVPIDYWATIDFQGFVQIIDTLGGIDVNVPNEIVDNEYPDSSYGTFVLTIPAGQQHMDGERALQYARTRHSSSDFERARRQQQIILAVRDKVLSPQVLPKLPRLIQACLAALTTNADPQMVLSVASLAPQLKDVTVDNRVIDESMAPNYFTSEGAQVLMPDWPAIRLMLQQMYGARLPQGQPLANTGVRIENATDLGGLAGLTAQFLQGQGATVISYVDREAGTLQRSQLYVYADSPQAVQYLRSFYHLKDDQVVKAEGGPPGVALNLVLGWDVIAGE